MRGRGLRRLHQRSGQIHRPIAHYTDQDLLFSYSGFVQGGEGGENCLRESQPQRVFLGVAEQAAFSLTSVTEAG